MNNSKQIVPQKKCRKMILRINRTQIRFPLIIKKVTLQIETTKMLSLNHQKMISQMNMTKVCFPLVIDKVMFEIKIALSSQNNRAFYR